MPFTGQVGGQAFTSTPTLNLAQQTNVSTNNYPQPLWSLTGFGDYLALAQLDVQALVSQGMNNAAGSLGSLGQTSWQDVPFSTTNVGKSYNWSNGVDITSQKLYQNTLVIDGRSRIQGKLPTNNYGATFTIFRGSVTTSFTLSGNLSTDTSVMTSSLKIAAGIAFNLNQKLAGTGIGCREQPGHPGFLEFFAIDPAITGFTMDPYNSTVNGQVSANGFQKLGFFAEQNSSLSLKNGSFEGPYAVSGGNQWIALPSGAQWVFAGSAGLATNQTTTWAPTPLPDGSQLAYIQGASGFQQTLVGMDAGSYTVSFYAAARLGYTVNPIQVLVDGQNLLQLTSLTNPGWTQYTTSPITLTAGNHTLQFSGLGVSGQDADIAIDNVFITTQSLTADQATYPNFSSLQGMTDLLNQENLVGTSPTPKPLPGTDTGSGNVYINGKTTYMATNLPNALQFVANAFGNNITPLLFSMTGSGSSATYTLVSAGQAIPVNRAGLQTASLVFPGFTPSASSTFVLGFSDRSMNVSTGTLSTISTNRGTVGFDSSSSNGSWQSFAVTGNFLLGNTFGSSGTSFTSTAALKTYAISAFQGLAQSGSGSVSRPNTDTTTANSTIYTQATYNTSFLPTSVRLYANSTGTITPMLFSYTSGGTYQVAALGSPITISSSQLGLVDTTVFFPTLGSLTTGTTYLFGFKNSAAGVVALQSGASTTGGWLSTTTNLTSVGNAASFSAAGIYSMDIIASQTGGSPVIVRSLLDTTSGSVQINPSQTYQNSVISGFGVDASGWTLAKTTSGPATVSQDVLTLTSSSMASIYNGFWNNTPINGLASGPWGTSFTFNDTTGTKTDGGSFVIQTGGTSTLGTSPYGMGINPGLLLTWNLNNSNAGGTKIALTQNGVTSAFVAPGSINMGLNSPTNIVLSYDGIGTITLAMVQGTNTYTQSFAVNLSSLDSNAYIGFVGGQGTALATTTISNFQFATGAPVLPTAMQVYATVPSSGSGWITPFLFQVGGTTTTPTYTLVAAATSVEVKATGAVRLPVAFDPTVKSTLNRGGTYVMGFGHRDVDILTGGAFTTPSTSTGIVQYASGGTWLASGTISQTGLVLGTAFTGSSLTGNRAYSVTFLTDATQYDGYSPLISVQYAGGQQVYVSYADINESSTDVTITADAINQANIPNVSNLVLTGAEDVEVAIAATRQFTLKLDASVFTNGASAVNIQQQAHANPVTTGVLTSISVQQGNQPFGVDGFISPVIPVTSSTQSFATAPVLTISDKVSAGEALQSSTLLPAYGVLPDLMLGQYAGFTVQAWFNSTNIGSNWQRIIDLGNGTTNNIIVAVNSSKIALSIHGTSTYDFMAGPTLANNTWYHVSAVFSGTSASLYLNGVWQGTHSGMPQYQNMARSNNYWGKSNWSADPVWQGQQDELRFWNRALTAQEIGDNYNTIVIPYSGSGLLAQYHADELSGTTLLDSSNNDNNATLVNAITNPVQNAGFESPVVGNSKYTTNPANAIWTFLSSSGIASYNSGWFTPAAPEGVQGAFLQKLGSFSQSITIATSGTYSLSCKAVGRAGYTANSINVFLDTLQVGTINASSLSSTAWSSWTSSAIPLSAGTHTIQFLGVGNGTNDVDSAIDNVTLDYQSRAVSTAPLLSKGYGATLLANLDPVTGKMTGVTLTNPGSGYIQPFVQFGTENNARATASLTKTGSLASIKLVSGGNYYSTPPLITILDRKGTGYGATATAILTNGVVTSISLTNAGSGYGAPMMVIAPAQQVTLTRESLVPIPTISISDGTGVGATATVSLDQCGFLTGILVTDNQASASVQWSNGSITEIDLVNGGQFYSVAPTVTITDSDSGTGSGATATATIASGVVTGITLVNNGSNYTSPVVTLSPPSVFNSGYVNPVVTISNNTPATATSKITNGSVSSISILTSGIFYGTVPPVITLSGGGGTGASATATVFNGAVTAITVNNGGSGYTSVPTITIAPPITATATVTQGVKDALLDNVGAYYTTTPKVAITDSSGNGSGAQAYAVLNGGLVTDIVVTNYGTNYTTPVLTIDPPTLDITQSPTGDSTLFHEFYFLDGSSWSTTTTSHSSISLQYQLVDHFTSLDDLAGTGLTGGNGNTTPGYYNLAAYINPLLSSSSPNYAEAENLSIVMPETSTAPLLWYASAASGADPYVSQALFPNNQWNVATLGEVTLGNIDLYMNMAGNNGSAGFTGSAQVGYVDFNLVADSFTPDIDFELQTTPGLFANFDTWQANLSDDDLLAKNAAFSATIQSYDLTLNALVSQSASVALGQPLPIPDSSNYYQMPYYTSTNPYSPNSTTYPIPNITFSVDSANKGTFSNSNFGNAEGLLYIDKSDLGTSFDQFSTALSLTDTSSWLGNNLPFVGGTAQDITGFSSGFTTFVQDNLVSDIPSDFDSLVGWVSDNSAQFQLAYGPITVGSTSGYGLSLTPIHWQESVSATTQVAMDVATIASLAGGFNSANLPPSQSDLTYLVVPPANTGNITFSLDASWGAPFGALLTKSGSGTGISYQSSGFIGGSSTNFAWNLANITISGTNLDFQGTLGTTPIYFDFHSADVARISVSGAAIQTQLGTNQLATSVVTSSLTGSVAGGSWSANLPVYYPTATCYSGKFAVSGVNGASSASLAPYMAQEALFTAQIGSGGALTGFTKINQGANYASAPQVVITDAAGLGKGATATAVLSAGTITSITLTNAGSGYVSPVVTLVGAQRNSSSPTGTKSVTFTLPEKITNGDIAALSLANAVGDPNVFQSGITTLQSALSKVFTASMGSQIIIGTGTSQFAQAFDLYKDIANYLDEAITPFVPQCDQTVATADSQLYSEATTVYNAILATPGLVLDSELVLTTGSYLNSQSNKTVTGALPTYLDSHYNILTFSTTSQSFVNSQGVVTDVESVEFPLIVDYTLENTTIPFSLGLPGLPLSFDNPANLNLIESGDAIVDLSFGVDAFNGFFMIPDSSTQFSGTLNAGPAANFSTTMTLGFLSGSMSAQTGDIFSMPFSTVLTDPDKNGQLTLDELNKLTPSSLFQTTLENPTVGLNIDFELKVAGGGIAAAIPGIGNTMSISWTPGTDAPAVSYDNFYIDLGSFISDFMGSVAPQLLPITTGVQPILDALNTPLPVLGEIIGGDTSLLGLANRFGAANTGFVTALDGIAEMLTDITSAVNYITQNPGISYHVPLAAVATFADDFRSAASGLSKPQQITQLPSKQQSIDAVNSFLNQYQDAASNAFTEASSKIINQDYGSSGSLGISFDILDPQNIINLITGQTADIFHINFPTLSANFSIEEDFELYGPLFMTFGGGVSAEVNLSVGFDSAGLEQLVQTTLASGGNLSTSALEGLLEGVIMDGLFIDGDNTAITADGYVSMGVMLNGGIVKAGVEGKLNLDLSMTPNVDGDGRLNLSEMVQIAGANFSTPLNLFDFEFKGTISADAYLKAFLPFKWKKVWKQNYGSFTVFDIKNDPTPPTPNSADNGSLFLNMGPTAGRRSHHGTLKNEHFEVRHLGGVAGDETVSLQFFVDGKPQYLDEAGLPRPHVYHHIDKVVGIAGDGDDTIDCSGVLSPTHLVGGGGKDTLIGGDGENHLEGGPGADQLIGGLGIDTILGGHGNDLIHGGDGEDLIHGGHGDDQIDHSGGPTTIHFADGFSKDAISPLALQGSILDFSNVSGNLTVTLGATNTINIGTQHSLSWMGQGPTEIRLGKGLDTILFNKGYSSTTIHPGEGQDIFNVHYFEPGEVITLAHDGSNNDNQILVQTDLKSPLTLDDSGFGANGARFNIPWATVRKVNIHENNATVNLAFGADCPDKVLVHGMIVHVQTPVTANTIKLDATTFVSVQANLKATRGGYVSLVTGPTGQVRVGTEKDALLSSLHGNVHIDSPHAHLGGIHSKMTTAITNGHFDNEATHTILKVPPKTGILGIQTATIVSAIGGKISITDTTGKKTHGTVTPFPKTTGEVRFDAGADLNEDGITDLVTTLGPGSKPDLKIISGKDLKILKGFTVFQNGFIGGVNVATGDTNADGVKDIIVAADAGAGPHVKVYSGKDLSLIRSFFAFDSRFRGGVRVACGDTNGDGFSDIITSTASGNSSHVRIFSGKDLQILGGYFAFAGPIRGNGGIYVSSMDLTGDGKAEIIAGLGQGNRPLVSVYHQDTKALDTFLAYDARFTGGVRVGHTNSPLGNPLIVTAPGPGGSPNVRTFDPINRFKQIDSFFAGAKEELLGVIL